MGIIVGIDIGGSTTKIVGIRDEAIISPLQVRANDPIASVFGAFGKFLDRAELTIKDVDNITVTGVGASFVTKPIYGISTYKVQEFLSSGLGGLNLSGLQQAIIVSMGTGTALVKASKNQILHLGGSGIGGGTLLGLSNRMLNVRDIKLLRELAQGGDLSNVDLLVGDISRDQVPGLPPYTTASNFGKISDNASREDIALGIINLVLQSVGVMASMAARATESRDVVLIGNMTTITQGRAIFDTLSEFFEVNFIIPENAKYATAVGAALAYLQGKECAKLR